MIGIKHLPKGAKPPATVDEGGLRLFRDSILEYDSVSGVVDLLPVFIACDKFYRKITTPSIRRLTSSQLYLKHDYKIYAFKKRIATYLYPMFTKKS